MAPISYRRHRFPPIVIQHAVWLYLRFTLSYRDVEELFAERGLDISYESVRSWVLKFGPAIARGLRRCRPRPSDRWHLDEMVVRIAGKHSAVPTPTRLSPSCANMRQARCGSVWRPGSSPTGSRSAYVDAACLLSAWTPATPRLRSAFRSTKPTRMTHSAWHRWFAP